MGDRKNAGDKKKGMSTNTMIEIGLGAAVVVEGMLLALLFKKVNELAAKTDPTSNDNKYIAQYVHLLETTVGARLKEQNEKITALDDLVKKGTNVAGSTEKIAALENDLKQLRIHINKLTESHNKLAAQLGKVLESQDNNRGRTKTRQYESEDSYISENEQSPSPPPVKQPVRRNVASTTPVNNTKKPTTTQNQQKKTQQPIQRTQKKLTSQQPKSATSRKSREDDEKDSDVDYGDT